MDERESLVEELKRVVCGMELEREKLQDLLMCSPEADLFWEMYEATDLMVRLVGERLGDQSGWLEYYAGHCKWGKESGYVEINGKGYKIKSIKGLLRVIDVDNKGREDA